MVLSDVDIRRYLEEGKIKIAPPLPPEQFGSCSVDFRLGSEFSVFEHSRHALIDLKERTSIQDLMRTVRLALGKNRPNSAPKVANDAESSAPFSYWMP